MNTNKQSSSAARAAPNSNAKKRKRPPKSPSQREQLILFALGKHERYGLEIQDTIKGASNGEESISIGTLYPTLQNLEKKGLVASRPGTEISAEHCDKKRKYFRLTEQGQETLNGIIAYQERLLSWDK